MKLVYFIPVRAEFLSKWEYYSADYDLLCSSGAEVVVCSSYWSFFRNFLRADYIFAWWWGRSIGAIVLCRIFGVPIFVTGAIHMFDLSGSPSFYRKSFFYRLFNRLGLSLATQNVFISEHQRLSVESSFSLSGGFVLYPSLSKSFLKVRDSMLSSNTRERVFLCHAWLTDISCLRKGIYDALEAFSRAVSGGVCSSFRLVIFGKEGDAIPILRKRIEQLGISSRVSIEVDVSLERKIELYKSSWVLVAPSYMEGFGNANLESMSCGLPVICYSEGASKESVLGAGIVVSDVSVSGLTDALCQVASLGEAEMGVLRKAAIERVESCFSEDVRLSKFRQVLSLNGF